MSDLPNKVLLANMDLPRSDFGSDLFHTAYPRLDQKLRECSSIQLQTALTLAEFDTQLEEFKPSVILFVNEALVIAPSVLNRFLPFLQSGGIAVLCALFPNGSPPKRIDTLLASIGLPAWKTSDYHRTDFQLTPVGKANLHLHDMKETYSSKALQLSGVAPEHQIYTPRPNALTQSLVFAPSPSNPNNTMATLARIASGAVSYIGDCNNEDGTNQLILQLFNSCKVAGVQALPQC